MAAFYIDNDVGADLSPALVALGHEATLTSALGLEEASDGRQLFSWSRTNGIWERRARDP